MNRIGMPQFVNPTKIEKWKSSWITPTVSTTGTVSVPANAFDGNFPDKIYAEVEMTSALAGWVAGDRIFNNYYSIYDSASGAAIAYGLSLGINSVADTIDYVIGDNGLAVLHQTAHNWLDITAACKFRIIAERTVIGDIPDITRVGLVPLEKKIVNNGDADVQFNLAQYFNEYEDFRVEFNKLRPITDSVVMQLRVSADNGTTFDSGASDYRYDSLYSNGVTAMQFDATDTNIRLSINGQGNASDEDMSGSINIYKPQANSRLAVIVDGFSTRADGLFETHTVSAKRLIEQITTDIQIIAVSGNLAEGTLILYGKRKVA